MNYAVGIPSDCRDNRDQAIIEKLRDEIRINLDDVTYLPDVNTQPINRSRATFGNEEIGILTGHAHGERTMVVNQTDQFALHLTYEHHRDYIHDLPGGDPISATELGLNSEPCEHGVDLRAATVNDHGAKPCQPKEDDVLREARLEIFVDHRVAAILHDDRRPVECLQPGKSLGENHRLGTCVMCGMHGNLSGRVSGVLVYVVGGQVIRPDSGGFTAVIEIYLDANFSACEGD